MEVVILNSENDVARFAADYVCRQIRKQRSCSLGLPTGSTPLGLYRELVARYKDGKIDFSQVVTFNLDEYVGLPQDHPSSYYKFMAKNLFNHINIPQDSIYIPNGMAENIPQECHDYERAIAKEGGIDLQVLGIGGDGHIAFNEPSSSLASRTRLKTLTEETRKANAPNFASLDEVPHHVITMGIGTIMEAKRVLLIATGEGKADAISRAVEGPITAMCPASILQMHRRAIIVIDEAASQKLTRTEYYKTVFAKKPDWQLIETV